MPIEPEPFEEGLPHRFFTLKQVAAMLATSEAQVYALVRAGDLPAIKIGGRGQWRVENRELDQWIQAQYQKTRPADEETLDPEDRKMVQSLDGPMRSSPPAQSDPREPLLRPASY